MSGSGFVSFSLNRDSSPRPHTPGSAGAIHSPWSRFLRDSPGLWTGGRATSLPPTPSELRSTLGHEEDPFSAAFEANEEPSAALREQEQHVDRSRTGSVEGAGKKRARSVEDAIEAYEQGQQESGQELPPRREGKRPAFALGAFGMMGSEQRMRPAARPAEVGGLSFSSDGDSLLRRSGEPTFHPTPDTSVEPSPKVPLYSHLNSLAVESAVYHHQHYQLEPLPLVPLGGTTTAGSTGLPALPLPCPPPHRPPMQTHRSFDFSDYMLRRDSSSTTPPAPLPAPNAPPASIAIAERRRSSASSSTLSLPPVPISPAAVPIPLVVGPKKRGRKPKDPNAPVDPVKAAKARVSALERNRIAASKSRAKKRSTAASAETTVADLSTQNAHLQATALALRTELLALRRQLDVVHPPQPGTCQCAHVNGYRVCEAAGGGIPTLERLAGETMRREYGVELMYWEESGRRLSGVNMMGGGGVGKRGGQGRRSESEGLVDELEEEEDDEMEQRVEKLAPVGRKAIPLKKTRGV